MERLNPKDKQSRFIKKRALEFPDEQTFDKVLGLLFDLADKEPIEFEPLGENDVLMPQRTYDKLTPLLEQH